MYTYTCVDVSHLCRPPTPSTFINWINGCINFWAVSSGPHDWKNGDRIMMINHRTFGFQIVETPYRTYTQVSQWQKCPNSTVQSIPLSVKSPKFLLAKPYVLVKNELLLLTSEILVNFASLNLNCLLFIFLCQSGCSSRFNEVCPSILRCFKSQVFTIHLHQLGCPTKGLTQLIKVFCHRQPGLTLSQVESNV